jgi:hypothetical protein
MPCVTGLHGEVENISKILTKFNIANSIPNDRKLTCHSKSIFTALEVLNKEILPLPEKMAVIFYAAVLTDKRRPRKKQGPWRGWGFLSY